MADNVDDISARIESVVQEVNEKITSGMKSRAYAAANELRNSSQEILRGQRSGRTYRIPGSKGRYTASAPGEPPAVRTGAFRSNWQAKTETTGNGTDLSVKAFIESNTKTDNGKYLLGQVLEEGSRRMAPRPYKEAIQQDALPRILKIYKKPYL